MDRRLDILAVSPPGYSGSAVAAAAFRAGFLGGVSLEHSDPAEARRVVDQLVSSRVSFCLFLPVLNDGWRSLVQENANCGLIRVVLASPDMAALAADIAWLRGLGVEAYVEATCEQVARAAEESWASGVVIKGGESGGAVGEETTFVLLQRVGRILRIPMLARGGVGLHSAAACLAGGAAGMVLDWQLALSAESELPEGVKTRIARMDGSETAILGQSLGAKYRAYNRPGETGFAGLTELEDSLCVDSGGREQVLAKWRGAVEARTRINGDGRLLLFGQDAVLAGSLAEKFQTVGGVCAAIQSAATRQCRLAARQEALRPGGALATSHGTRYPIVQGPMTRVSDTAEFALSVAQGGGLPFLALALLRGPQVATLLEETKRKLGALPWGVGILGFVPRELREEQLAEVRKHPSPYALIAGGRPDQAAELERENIHTYLHVPSPGLLSMFLENGARRVIFEGRECGGHVGPRTSFILWEQMIGVILTHLSSSKSKAEEYHVLFAGGIHDAKSAAMVAAMAAPLIEHGVRIGVLLGTSYLFTKEAVTGGAIVEGFQQEALACKDTILLESGVGHATRCADTPFGQAFEEEKRRLIREGRSKEEIREALETLNLGRLRIASKGITRDEAGAAKFKTLQADEQRGEGMYMIGQVAALRDRICTIEELHEDVSRVGAERLRAFAAAAPRVTSSDTARPSDVAIVGMSCLFPKAGDLRTFWDNIVNKVNAIGEIPGDRWDWKSYFDADRTTKDRIYSKWGGFLDDVLFDPTRYGMPPNSLPSVEPLQLLVLEGVRDALRDAGYLDRPFHREKTSVVLGAGGGVADLGLGYGFRALLPYFMKAAGGTEADAAELIERLEGSLPEWTEDSFAGLLMNVAAGRVANRFDLGGSNYTVDAACASSLAAVRLGVNELETGAADMVIVGGADTMQSPFAYLCFSKTQALSPTGQCKTFDASADGIVISEGIAFAILKRVADAERDGDRIYAVIKGVGSSSDGRDKGLTAPRPAGQIRALERAYEKAGYSPKNVGLVEAHGTGTVAGDQSEVESLTRAFTAAGAEGQRCALGSVKSLIGHTKCTAGVAGMVKAALALHHKVLPPTHGVKQPNPKAKWNESPFYINAESRPWTENVDGSPRRAGVSAFGFGGTNFHAALEEYRGVAAGDGSTLSKWPSELFVWRAESSKAIVESLQTISTALAAGSRPVLADLAAAVCGDFAGRAGWCALAIVAESVDDLAGKIGVALAALTKGQSEFRDPKGVYYGENPLGSGDKIAFLFPGQGSQSVNMLRDLATALPGVREVFEEADRALGTALGRTLTSLVFPHPKFTPEETAADETALTRTQVAQPAIGAADLAMFRVLESLGIRPDMVAGHSYGEYAALCVAGAWSVGDLMTVSEARGRLIGQAAAASPGTMAAVDTNEATTQSAIAGLDGVWIANLNAPLQTVITGTAEGVDAALAKLKVRGVAGRRIKVSCAFHSPLVAAAKEPFRSALEGVAFVTPRVAVYSNTTGRPHAGGPKEIRDLLAEHLVRPVRFAEQISAMHADGARVFVEVGPGRVLRGLTEKTLAGEAVSIISTDQAGRNGLTQLCHALARMFSAGVGMRLGRLFAGRVEKVTSVAEVLSAGKPITPSPTTWKVNGARATPFHASPKPVKAKPVAAPTLPRITQPSSAAPPTIEPAKSNGNGALVTRSSQPSPAAAAPPQADGVMGAYQALMSKFLDTQKNVMLAYLQGGGSGTTPVTPQANVSSITASPGVQPVPQTTPTPVSTATHVDTSSRVQEDSRVQEVAGVQEFNGSSDATGWSREKIADRLVKIVSDRTGYPADMLNLDSDMEADLGIDSIKRVEILGNLQSESILTGASLDKDMEALAKLKTLRAIVEWVAAKIENQDVTRPSPTPASAARTVDAPAVESIVRRVVAVCDAPLAHLDQLNLRGAALIVDDGSALGDRLIQEFGALHIPTARLNTKALSNRDEVARATRRIRSEQGSIAAMIHLGSNQPATPHAIRAELVGLLLLTQILEPDLRGGRAKLLAIRRMDGAFGASSAALVFEAGQGGVCGFVKSVAREWPEVRCRVLDLGAESEIESVEAVLAELACNDELVETGRVDGRRITLSLTDRGIDATSRQLSLDSKDVVLITGGARGITAQIAVELAERFRCRLVLCGRSALPPETESSSTAGQTEMKSLKAALRLELEARGDRATPAAVEAAYARLLADRDIRESLAAMRRAGSAVEYHLVDVADASAFGAVIDGVYAKHGRLDGVIHGAGVTEDKFLADKTVESFERVLAPKIDAAFMLAGKLRGDSLKFLTFFSSVSARFGNRGQADYAAANEVLNKLARRLNATWPGRVTSLNWGPWESTGGMVSPELAKQFAKNGVQMITRAAGRRIFIDELLYGAKEDAEVVFGGPLHIPDPTPTLSTPAAQPPVTWPLLNCRSRVTRREDGSVEISRELDPSFDLYLLDHQLDGKPVMPMAVGLELLCEVALSAGPDGARFSTMRDLRVLRGITLEEGPRILSVTASPPKNDDGLVRIELRAKTDGQKPFVCYTATAELSNHTPAPPRRDDWTLSDPRPFSMSVEDAYEKWLFHGPLFAGITEVERIGENGIIARLSPSSPSRCLAETSKECRWIVDPVIVDSGLQLLILWARTFRDATPLPSRFGAFHRYGDLSAGEVRCEARIRPGAEGNPSIHADLMFYSLDGVLLGWLEDMEVACSKALNRLGRTRAGSPGA